MGSGFCSRPRRFPLAGAAASWRGLRAWSFTGLLLALCGPPANPFEVTVEGTSEVGYGGSVLLNCSSDCRDAGALGGLETSLSKERVGQGPGWLSIRLRNITEPCSDVFCYFFCFGERKTVTFTVLAYDLPEPLLSITKPNASSKDVVTIECSSEPSRPPGLMLQLHGSHRPPQPWAEGPLRLEMMVEEKDDGAEFTCEAQLHVGNRTLRRRSAMATLRVSYQPWMEDGTCPPSQNWTEGQDGTLQCWARGNPAPRLVCTKDGESFPVGVPRPITRDHAGIYRCQATNPLGAAERDITVSVLYDDPDLVVPTLVALAVVVGAVVAAVAYGIYHRKKKTRLYRLRRRQLEMLEMKEMTTKPPRPGQEKAPLNGLGAPP